MKRMICGLLTAAILAASCAGLCACNPEPEDPAQKPSSGGLTELPAAEPFVGVASEEVYDSAEEAAEAFFLEEVSGEDDNIVFVAYEKKGTLSKNEISALALSKEDKAELVSAERGEVVYYDESEGTEEQTATLAAGELSRSEYRIKMFVLYMKNNCKYYVPPVETGERLTKSYYMSLFNIEKYTNCTMTMIHSDSSIASNYIETFEYAGEQFSVIIQDPSIGGPLYAHYFPYKEGGCVVANYHGDAIVDLDYWYIDETESIVALQEESLSRALDLMLEVGLIDCNALIKTEKGFEGHSFRNSYYTSIKGEIKDNRLVSFIVEVEAGYVEITFTDFGTTKIDIPKEVQRLYDEYVKEHEGA